MRSIGGVNLTSRIQLPTSKLMGQAQAAERNIYSYTGYQLDQVSGLQFAQARYYLAEVGRFISEDPMIGQITDPESLNRYVYCLSNPYRYLDPSGLTPEVPKPETKAVANASAGCGLGDGTKYETKALLEEYVGENMVKSKKKFKEDVVYLTDKEREQFKLNIKDGRFYDAQGNPFDTMNGEARFRRRSFSADILGKAIFVMDKNGNIYASKYQEAGYVHHSTLLAGQPVAAAGEIEVFNGYILKATNNSGHYKPEEKYMQQFCKELKSKNANTTMMVIELES